MEENEIDQEAVFIDGTKIEANANKFTFVWRKSIHTYRESLVQKSNELYDELVKNEIIPQIERESSDELSIEELSQIADQLEEKVDELTSKIEESNEVHERKHLRSKRKEPKKAQKQFQDFVKRKTKYENDMAIFNDRNSYSKTDHDATFMRMKDDYMKNGQLKAGYNVQIATEGQYTLAYDVFPNPTDTRTLRPFLDEIEQHYFELPDYIVADAGYGSEENYLDVQNRTCTPLITYGMYRKEKKKRVKNDPFRAANWAYNEEEDSFTCPYGKKVTFRFHSNRTDRYEYTKELKVYECEDCSGCPFRSQCTKAKEGNNRQIHYNQKWEQQKRMIQQLLSEEKTGKIYGKRKIDVEPVFGCLKANLRFTRMSVRGKENVKKELGFAFMAVNVRKYIASSKKRSWTHPTNQQKGFTSSYSDDVNPFFVIFG